MLEFELTQSKKYQVYMEICTMEIYTLYRVFLMISIFISSRSWDRNGRKMVLIIFLTCSLMQDSKKGARGVSTRTALYSSAGVLGKCGTFYGKISCYGRRTDA